MHLEEAKDHAKMLLSLFVIITVYRGVGVVRLGAVAAHKHGIAKVFLSDKLAPYLHNLLIKVASVGYVALLPENLTHVVVRAAEVDALRSVELAL
jgi:uncharacterized membrane protein